MTEKVDRPLGSLWGPANAGVDKDFALWEQQSKLLKGSLR